MLKRFSLFASGSSIGAVIDYLITLTVTSQLGFDPSYALALAMIISASFVFFFHTRVTFNGAKRGLVLSYALFMGWSGLVFVLRAFLLNVILYAGLSLAVALLIAIGLASIINFAISSAVIFAKHPS